ncbi:MAG: hypothetical protein JWN70_4217 [Planctomycetaceae bacterium]|nr:hypothetical protein [Planctomycetaceae bacterium]
MRAFCASSSLSDAEVSVPSQFRDFAVFRFGGCDCGTECQSCTSHTFSIAVDIGHLVIENCSVVGGLIAVLN